RAGTARAHAWRDGPARPRPLPGRPEGEAHRAIRPGHRAAVDLASVSRHCGRAARLPVHGERATRPAARAVEGGAGGTAPRPGDRRVPARRTDEGLTDF